MSNCGCYRGADPAGTWSYNQLVGAKVMIKSISLQTAPLGNIGVSQKSKSQYQTGETKYVGSWRVDVNYNNPGRIRSTFSMDKVYTIKDIYFRCSLDGKVITVVELEDCPGCVFIWKDLELIDIPYSATAICGQAICGKTLCGEISITYEQDS